MGKINFGRVLFGGIVAGVILSVGEWVLNEKVLGAEDKILQGTLDEGILQGSMLPPTLTFDELKERIHGARRKLLSMARRSKECALMPPV